jgi:hypothetical protein
VNVCGNIGRKRAYAAGSAVAQRAHDVNTVVVARVQQYGQSGVCHFTFMSRHFTVISFHVTIIS